VYEADQSDFVPDSWLIPAPTEAALKRRMAALPRLEEFLKVPQGVITGADDVFILDAEGRPDDEPTLFVPLLRDREMQPYTVPKRTAQFVFYPFFKGKKVTEDILESKFSKTWDYLQEHREQLSRRGSLVRYGKQWWEPMWPRDPDILLRPKLVVPHLVIMPRFAFDKTGRYAVSHSPFLIARERSEEDQILKLMLGILNSSACFWHIQRNSHVYRHGYIMLESKTLEKTPVPDISRWSAVDKKKLLTLVDRRLRDDADRDEISAEIDEFVADAYGLNPAERRALGL
jgi:hypothetical protein